MSTIRKTSRFESGLLVTGVLLLALCSCLLGTMPSRVRATEKIKDNKVGGKEFTEQYERFSEVMAEIIVQVQEKYVEDVDPDRVFKAALNGVFDALDPHSGYLGPENFQALEKSTEGEFSGIGVHISQDRYGILTVISPIPGTPAARAGLRAWDRIVEIEGETTEDLTTNDAVKLLTGPIGTMVHILVYRPGETERLPFTIERNRIKIDSVYSNMDDGEHVTEYFKYLRGEKIGYARLAQFSENIAEDLQKALKKMNDDKIKGLILDLRYNSGGLLMESINVSDLFLDKDQVVVVTKGRLKEQNREYTAKNDKAWDKPMIVLVNESTASASEILAGALQDHKRAVLIGPEGANTYGKGLVQTISPLRVSLEKGEDGNDPQNAIRLTTAKYYTPNNAGEGGKSIHLVGIEPNIRVKITDEQRMDLLRKGWLMGDPASIEPTEDEEPTAEELKSQNEKEAVKEEEKSVEDEKNTVEDEKNTGEEEDDTPFYMRKKHQEPKKLPATEDVMLKYAVDLMHGILFAGGEGKN